MTTPSNLSLDVENLCDCGEQRSQNHYHYPCPAAGSMHFKCSQCGKLHGSVMLVQSGGLCHNCGALIPYQCKNCGTEVKSRHTHKIYDCFTSLRQRIEALEKRG